MMTFTQCGNHLSLGLIKYTTPIEWSWAFMDMNNGKRTDA